MKRFVLSLFIALLSISANAVRYNLYYDGMWHGWDDVIGYSVSGYYANFYLYNRADGFSNYVLRVTINDYKEPDKKIKKMLIKNNQWIEFDGTVEYFICDDYPTAYDIFKNRRHYYYGLAHYGLNLIYWNYRDEQWNQRPTVRVKKGCKVRIAPFKKRPEMLNVSWENVGLGINLND